MRRTTQFLLKSYENIKITLYINMEFEKQTKFKIEILLDPDSNRL